MIKEQEQNKYSIGVDVGGTKMSAVLFDIEKKEVVSDYKLATPTDILDKFLVMLSALIEPLLERAKKDKIKVEKIGVGVPGVLSAASSENKEGKILKCPNLEILDGVSLGKIIEERYNIPVSLDNDANCFLRAEVNLGAVQKSTTVVGITIGTGIGGGVGFNPAPEHSSVRDKQEIYQGVHGSAGEIGHMIVDTVEGIGMSLEQVYHNLTKGNPANMAEQAYNGDKLAIKVFEEVGKYIGLALASVVNLIDPEIIVLGGSVVESSDLFMVEIKKSLKQAILSPKLKKIKVVKGKVENAGAVGAALL